MCPKNWNGYIRIMVGFLILTVLLSPVLKFKNVEIFEMQSNIKFQENTLEEKVKKELEEKVEADICGRLQAEFNQKVEAEVKIETDKEGKICGVKNIVIKMKKISPGVKERLEEVYGCEDIELKLK